MSVVQKIQEMILEKRVNKQYVKRFPASKDFLLFAETFTNHHQLFFVIKTLQHQRNIYTAKRGIWQNVT